MPPVPGPPRLLVRDALLGGDPPRGGVTLVLEGGRVARVAAAGTWVEARPGDVEIDARGRLVVPGRVDAHTHLAAGPLLRQAGLPGRWPGSARGLRVGFRRPLEDRLDPGATEALAAAGALAALRAGTTTVLALERGMPGREEETLEAAERAVRAVGLRAVLALGTSDLGGPARAAAAIRAGEAFGRAREGDPRVRGAMGLDGLHATTRPTLESLAEPARRLGLHASIAEDGADLERSWALDGEWPVLLLRRAGLLHSRTFLGHGSTLGTLEAEALRDADATLVITPRAAAFWDAEPASPEILAAVEPPVALGTDGIFPDLGGEAVALAERLRRRHSGPPPPDGWVGRSVWETGARLAGAILGERLGRIEEGAAADLAVLEGQPTAAAPEGSDADVALLWAGAPAAWVVVGGEVRLREGAPVGVDPREVAARAAEAARRVLAG
jgi:cytosine/adenosine deaminase-related metal-dependent hydrolase